MIETLKYLILLNLLSYILIKVEKDSLVQNKHEGSVLIQSKFF
jgi:hypothetical protein